MAFCKGENNFHFLSSLNLYLELCISHRKVKDLYMILQTLSHAEVLMRRKTIYVCMWIFITDGAGSHISFNLFNDDCGLCHRNYYPYFTNTVNEVIGR